MIYEDDKLKIPRKYRKMPVPELRAEREKVYAEHRKKHPLVSTNTIKKTSEIAFKF